eukprot:Gregarina_sp_Poly_1__9404@NODE_588_length_7367_cov_108_309726_g454_i0_p2_GENE_NODE_588_length_7367_cov_108_309726_g454_i0NODE_588_length_7367_cov_108_309726_g454_i0_p2_ORF_typecomplete_len474_score47_09ResB/PF05140_14/44ResB/PF05140_14/1_5_NODE_588_length_7367_cov_108_309726_g454_i027424163
MPRQILMYRTSDASFVMVSLMVIKYIVRGLIAVRALKEQHPSGTLFPKLVVTLMTLLMTLSFILYWIGLLPINAKWDAPIFHASLSSCLLSSAMLSLLYSYEGFRYLIIHQAFDCTIFLLYAMTGSDLRILVWIGLFPFFFHFALQLILVGFYWELMTQLFLVTGSVHVLGLMTHTKIYSLALQQIEVESDPLAAARILPYYAVLWSHALHSTQRFLERLTASSRPEQAKLSPSRDQRTHVPGTPRYAPDLVAIDAALQNSRSSEAINQPDSLTNLSQQAQSDSDSHEEDPIMLVDNRFKAVAAFEANSPPPLTPHPTSHSTGALFRHDSNQSAADAFWKVSIEDEVSLSSPVLLSPVLSPLDLDSLPHHSWQQQLDPLRAEVVEESIAGSSDSAVMVPSPDGTSGRSNLTYFLTNHESQGWTGRGSDLQAASPRALGKKSRPALARTLAPAQHTDAKRASVPRPPDFVSALL